MSSPENDQKGAAPKSCLAVPVNSVPGSPIATGGWRLLGGLEPLEAGSFEVVLPKDRLSCQSLGVTLSGADSAKIHLFRYADSRWLSLGSGSEWQLELDHWDTGPLKLSVVVEIGEGEDAPGYPPRAFQLELICLTDPGLAKRHWRLDFTVPPVVLAASVDPVQEIWVVRNDSSTQLADALERLSPELGVSIKALSFPPDLREIVHLPQRANAAHRDVWIQDAVTIGKIAVPGADDQGEAVAVLSGVRALYRYMDYARLDLKIRDWLEQRGGVVFTSGEPRAKVRGIDWFGNLQVSPPARDAQGRDFPWGRLITGIKNGVGMHPGVLAFLEHQGIQTPALTIDTSWLHVGHVDEVITFIPVGAVRYRALMPSPGMAKEILRKLVDRGHGALPVFLGRKTETTVSELLHQVAMSEENRKIEEYLRRTRDRLSEEIGTTPDQFLPVPALFRDGAAVIPNPVNCLVCNGHLLVADPQGPIVNGEDAFARAIRDQIDPLGHRVHFLDVWDSLHARNGGIHCATNAVRWLRAPRRS